MIDDLKPLLRKLTTFAKDRLGFSSPPRLFFRKDSRNSTTMLGKTAHYDPQNKSVTVFVSSRHPKDILRSYCHELVHHCQNLRGDLAPEKMKTMHDNYAQENEHMRKMEEEAYLQGNMCFRDWEDGLENKLQYKMHLAEQKYLKEKNNMSVKINKKNLKGLIKKILNERLKGNIIKEFTNEPDMSNKREDDDENLEEGGCSSHGKREDKDACKHCGAKGDIHEEDCPDSGESIVDEVKDFPDVDQDGDEDEDISDAQEEKEENEKKEQGIGAEKSEDSEKMNEEIKTPEQENKLYESRFSKRNSSLFEKLVKEWTK